MVVGISRQGHLSQHEPTFLLMQPRNTYSRGTRAAPGGPLPSSVPIICMNAQSITTLLKIIALAAVPLLTGCETTSSAKKSERLTEPFKVQRGTLTSELIENLGEPDQKYPLADYSVEAVVWVYERRVGSGARMVLTGTREVPHYNPVTKETVYLPEPIMQPEMTHTKEVTKILVLRDRVVSWERTAGKDRAIEGMSR